MKVDHILINCKIYNTEQKKNCLVVLEVLFQRNLEKPPNQNQHFSRTAPDLPAAAMFDLPLTSVDLTSDPRPGLTLRHAARTPSECDPSEASGISCCYFFHHDVECFFWGGRCPYRDFLGIQILISFQLCPTGLLSTDENASMWKNSLVSDNLVCLCICLKTEIKNCK